ncbi:hypothetical protein QE431_004209 [Flavobacterium sp. SORGH_AS 622]|nr:hypothetical protein [Flavobacterium sp. SORGH_AS_0622]
MITQKFYNNLMAGSNTVKLFVEKKIKSKKACRKITIIDKYYFLSIEYHTKVRFYLHTN